MIPFFLPFLIEGHSYVNAIFWLAFVVGIIVLLIRGRK